MERAMTYFDGFNFYHGLKDKKWSRYYWTDLSLLSHNLLSHKCFKSSHHLVGVKYFTARLPATEKNKDSLIRQNIYIEAIKTLPNLKFFEGKYSKKKWMVCSDPNCHGKVICSKCMKRYERSAEKQTDVKLATEMNFDAMVVNNVDTVILVSGDTDFIPVIKKILGWDPSKKVVVAFPPGRNQSKELKSKASESFVIRRKMLKDSQFPDEIPVSKRRTLKRPSEWR